MTYRLVAVALTALLLSAHTPALAQGGAKGEEGGQDANRAAARDLGKAAVEAYKAGDYQTALDKFERAHQLVGLTTTRLWTARSLEKLGRLVQAAEVYLEVTRMSVADDAREQHRQALDDARTDRAALLPRIPKLTISVVGGDGQPVTVTLDGEPLPSALLDVKRPTDPGTHTIVATAGKLEQRATVALGEGQHEQVTLNLAAPAAGDEPGPPHPPIEPEPTASADEGGGSSMATLGWVAVAVGGAGLIVGAVGAGVAASKKSDLDSACPNNLCPPDQHDTVDSFESMRIMSSVGFIAGGVIAATGIVLVIAAPSDDEQAALRMTPYASPAGVGLVGWF